MINTPIPFCILQLKDATAGQQVDILERVCYTVFLQFQISLIPTDKYIEDSLLSFSEFISHDTPLKAAILRYNEQ